MKLCLTELDFLGKNILLLKLGKWSKMTHKCFFFNLLKSLATNFYRICSVVNIVIICTNPMFGKHRFPEIWAKMLSVNQNVGFSNQLCLQKKSIK